MAGLGGKYMFWGYRRSGNGRIDCGNRSGSLGFEQLEPRQLLSARRRQGRPGLAADEAVATSRAFSSGFVRSIARRLRPAARHPRARRSGVGPGRRAARSRPPGGWRGRRCRAGCLQEKPLGRLPRSGTAVSIADVYPNDPFGGCGRWRISARRAASPTPASTRARWGDSGSGSAIVAVIDTGVRYPPQSGRQHVVNAGQPP